MRRGTTRGLAEALRDWRRTLGARHVVTETGALRAAATATFRTRSAVAAILRPRTRAEVQACLRVANRRRVHLHPVSRGRNWGYGSRVPVRDGGVLLDLSRMDRILGFDERLGCVTLEPGVTFARLHAFLRRRGSRLHANAPGTTAQASPLANALERGLGFGPIGDRFSGVCGLEVVLPTGEWIRTGFARWPGAATATLHRWGVGPWADGLFSQSNLGVVTRSTLWLSPIPEHGDVLSGSLARRGGIVALVDALRPLFQRGVLRYPVKVMNDYRFLSPRMRFPWGEAGGRVPLPRRAVEARFQRPCPWILSGLLDHPTPAHRPAGRRAVRDALARAGAVVAFRSESAMRRGGGDGWEEAFRPTSGFDVAATYWRKRTPPPRRMDPDRDGCGAIWCSPVVPLVGRHVASAVAVVERAFTSAGFEPMLALTVLDGRTAHLVAPLLFDRSVPGEDGRALACAARLQTDLARRGYFPYRLGVNGMGRLPATVGDDATFRRALKSALDPRGVLSPGRYEERPRPGGTRSPATPARSRRRAGRAGPSTLVRR